MMNKLKSRQSKKIIAYSLIILAALFYALTVYKIKTFGTTGLDGLFFYLFNGLEGANTKTFSISFFENIVPFLVLVLVLLLPIIDIYKNKIIVILNLKFKKERQFKINPSSIANKYMLRYALTVFLLSLSYALYNVDIYHYVVFKSTPSSFIAENYIDPSKVELVFPETKRNLIYIYLESMENTIASRTAGGSANKSMIPELESMALSEDNISFSNTNKLGGMLPAYGSTWTIGAMVSQSSGTPLLGFSSFDHNNFGSFNKFVPGAYSLGDVLDKQGYYQELMVGSDANFGGRQKYFTEHGNYKIYDYKTALETERIADDYYVWWGYEDKKLFGYAKEELSRIAQQDQPFNFQLLTADTHFVDGYLNPSCATEYASQYENVFACSSKQVSDFIAWIKTQDFYKNTTVIVVGDHLGMQTEFYDQIASEDYQRTIYNAILNSTKKPIKENNRNFSSFDLYPTTLSSLGVEVKGDKLGLGVNLFSDKKTLIEEYGLDYVNTELSKRSKFYNDNILSSQ